MPGSGMPVPKNQRDPSGAQGGEARDCERDLSIDNPGPWATPGQLNCRAGTHTSSF
jgi:hypothetical protein